MVDLTEDSINLRALKKIDDNIREIIICAGQVAVYYYDINQDDWVRKNIEGTLFFVRRTNQPEYAFVVINRLNTINFVQKITKDLEINVQSPYLMYKNIEKEIYCIWFYDANQCIKLNENINHAMESINNPSKNLPDMTPSKLLNGQSPMQKSKQQASKEISDNNQSQASEILKLFFNNANLNESKNNQNSTSIGGDSFLPELFNQSKDNHDDNTNVSSSEQHQKKSDDDLVKPTAHRRSVNLKELFESQLVLKETGGVVVENHHNIDINETKTINKQQSTSTPLSKQARQTSNKNELLMSASPALSNSAAFIGDDDLKNKSSNNLPNASSSSNSQAPLLMSDNFMFLNKPQQPARNGIIQNEAQQLVPPELPVPIHPTMIPYPMNFESVFPHHGLPTVIPPPPPPPPSSLPMANHLANCMHNAFEIQQRDQQQLIGQAPLPSSSVSTGRTSISKSDMYLTMEQLKKTLIYLLSNDADFLHAIHTAYVENIKK